MSSYVTSCCGTVYNDDKATNQWTGTCPNEDCSKNITGFVKL